MSTCFCVSAGIGLHDPGQAPMVRAQLLGWLLFTTPSLLLQQLGAFGAADADQLPLDQLQQLLPGPYAVLRYLAAFDAGAFVVPCDDVVTSRVRPPTFTV